MDTNFLPEAPGCYIFKDSAGDCLYVGKSKNLRSRVRSYFNKNVPPKVKKLAMLIQHIDYQLAAGEIDALYLEHSLIKTHRPPFNVQMRKDLRPHYICINWTRKKPGIYISEKAEPEVTRYGSFTSAYEAREALTIVSRAWLMPSCEATHFDGLNHSRSCLNLHIGRCLGPCQNAQQLYHDTLTQAAAFMQGRNKQSLAILKQDMNQAVSDLDFEKAAKLRDNLGQLQFLQRRFRYRIPFQGKRICALVKGHHEPGFMMLYYKNGQLRQAMRLEGLEDWRAKCDGFILGMMGKNEVSNTSHIYTVAATIEIRARKLYVDVTKTSKANLPKRLDRAVRRFTGDTTRNSPH
ncbi:MAG: GIY-YIG nuclease family protein [Defluviitaleaceae bacterium]|nr:GIY-YIG nuclease family protein [Defluviitaleaceae bacterium]